MFAKSVRYPWPIAASTSNPAACVAPRRRSRSVRGAATFGFHRMSSMLDVVTHVVIGRAIYLILAYGFSVACSLSRSPRGPTLVSDASQLLQLKTQ